MVKDVYTTGEVARVCRVSPRTVSKWFDTGQLKGYRIPGSKDRRIPRDQLLRFMRTHGMPLKGLEIGVTRVLIVDDEYDMADLLRTSLERDVGYSVQVASNAFEAGMMADSFRPHVILFELELSDCNVHEVLKALKSNPDLAATRVIGVGGQEQESQKYLSYGFESYLPKPFNLRSVVREIENATNVLS
ncbi:MAG TPA: response regulator [Phycisphaerae bacterium]|nr:response regulator [Phycisphaerae bacterium]HOI55209.1 response regulator [Phycisphaerae bacterium]